MAMKTNSASEKGMSNTKRYMKWTQDAVDCVTPCLAIPQESQRLQEAQRLLSTSKIEAVRAQAPLLQTIAQLNSAEGKLDPAVKVEISLREFHIAHTPERKRYLQRAPNKQGRVVLAIESVVAL